MYKLKVFLALTLLALFVLAGTAFSAPNKSELQKQNRVEQLNKRLSNVVNRMVHNEHVTVQEKTQARPLFLSTCRQNARRHPLPQRTMETDTIVGPDGFGYTMIDNNTVGGPTYNWVDITSTGTYTGITGDDNFGQITLGTFSFPFYGTTINDAYGVYVNTNGLLTFGGGTYNYNNQPLPSGGIPQLSLAVCWLDGYVDTTPYGIFYQNMGDGRFVVEWVYRSLWSSSFTITCEAILYSNGQILYQYQSFDNPVMQALPTVGIQGSDSGTNFLAYCQNYDATDGTAYPTAGTAIQFFLLGAPSNPTPSDAATSVPTNTPLNWSLVQGATGYDVYLSTTNPPTTMVSSNQASTSYVQAFVTNSTYYWQIAARNGSVASPGPIWSFTTGGATAPNSPTGAVVTNTTTNSLTIGWEDNSSDETGFLVTHSFDGVAYSNLATTAPNATSYLDNTSALLPNTQCWYRVYAAGSILNSYGYTETSGFTLALVPGTPNSVTTGLSSLEIAINNGGNNNSTEYAIYETTTGQYLGATNTLGLDVAWRHEMAWGSSIPVTGLNPGTTYNFEVKARNVQSVETAFGPGLTVTTLLAYPLPISQNFADPNFPPTDWNATSTTTSGYPWQFCDNGNGGVNGAAFVNFYYDYTLETSILWSPPVNTVGISSGIISYDFWYSITGEYTDDSLIVVYSTDDGVTYTPLTFHSANDGGANNLVTVVDYGYYYYSLATDGWKNDVIFLPSGALNQSSVKFGWVAKKGNYTYSSTLGVDNISVLNGNVPLIAANPSHLAYGMVSLPTTATTQFAVKNIGGGVLHVSNMTASVVTITAPTNFTVAPGDSHLVTVNWCPTVSQSLTDNVVISSDAFINATLNIPVTGLAVGQTGGPDGFGYHYKTSLADGGPIYNWVDISGSADQSVLQNTDDGEAPIDLGTFTFPLYGSVYSGTIYVSSNCNITFGSGYNQTYQNQDLPTLDFSSPTICPCWDDWVLGVNGVVAKNMGDGRFIISWSGVHFSTSDTYECEAILDSIRGNILIQYRTISNGNGQGSMTIGIQNGDGSSYLQYANQSVVATSGTAILFYNANAYTPPGTPVVSVVYSGTSAIVSWATPSGTIDGYKVYRETTTGYLNPTPARLVATINGAANTSYTDVGVTGHEYYVVTAFNAAASSSSSVIAPPIRRPISSGKR